MQPLFVDFETYWDTDVSLNKLSTFEYIMHDEFEVIMCAIEDHEGNKMVLVGFDAIAEYFATVDWENTIGVAHNAIFDFGIVVLIFGYKPARYFCTMMASRPHLVPFSKSMGLGKLAEYLNFPVKKGNFASHHARGKHLADFNPGELRQYIKYADGDTDICKRLYDLAIASLNEDEQLLIHATLRKALEPQLVLDAPLVEDALTNEIARKERLFRDTGMDRETIMSNAKYANWLKALGISPPRKISPRTGKETWAFAKSDPEHTKLLVHSDERVRMAVECRINGKSTIEESRLARFLNVSTGLGGWLPFPLLYYGAHTGRLSGYDKMNMQNPTKGSALREAMCAAQGHKIVVSDLSQIEARMVAWLAGVDKLLTAFADPSRDVYCEFGNELGMWDFEVHKGTVKERFISKTAVLSLMYNAGWQRFMDAINGSGIAEITEEESKKVVYGYRDLYPQIKALWEYLNNILKGMIKGESHTFKGMRFVGGDEATMYGAPCVLLPEGRILYYPDLRMDAHGDMWYTSARGDKRIYGGAFLENISQALAQIIIRTIELRTIRKFDYKIWAAGQVHDELIFSIPDQIVDRFSRVLTRTMVEPHEWCYGLPLACETEVGLNYGDAK